MTNHFRQQIRRTAILTLALTACLIFGIIVLASGDWLPGGIIVAASTVALVREVPIIRNLCSSGYEASGSKHDAAE